MFLVGNIPITRDAHIVITIALHAIDYIEEAWEAFGFSDDDLTNDGGTWSENAQHGFDGAVQWSEQNELLVEEWRKSKE